MISGWTIQTPYLFEIPPVMLIRQRHTRSDSTRALPPRRSTGLLGPIVLIWA